MFIKRMIHFLKLFFVRICECVLISENLILLCSDQMCSIDPVDGDYVEISRVSEAWVTGGGYSAALSGLALIACYRISASAFQPLVYCERQ